MKVEKLGTLDSLAVVISFGPLFEPKWYITKWAVERTTKIFGSMATRVIGTFIGSPAYSKNLQKYNCEEIDPGLMRICAVPTKRGRHLGVAFYVLPPMVIDLGLHNLLTPMFGVSLTFDGNGNLRNS